MNCSLFIIYDVQVAPQFSWHCSCPFLGVFLEFKWLFKAGHVTCSNFQAIWGISQWPRLITTVLLYTTVQKNAGAFFFAVFLWSPPCPGHFPKPRKALKLCYIYKKSLYWWVEAGPTFPLTGAPASFCCCHSCLGDTRNALLLFQLTHPLCTSGYPKEQHPSQGAFQ